jgi:hypothetical protein
LFGIVLGLAIATMVAILLLVQPGDGGRPEDGPESKNTNNKADLIRSSLAVFHEAKVDKESLSALVASTGIFRSSPNAPLISKPKGGAVAAAAAATTAASSLSAIENESDPQQPLLPPTPLPPPVPLRSCEEVVATFERYRGRAKVRMRALKAMAHWLRDYQECFRNHSKHLDKLAVSAASSIVSSLGNIEDAQLVVVEAESEADSGGGGGAGDGGGETAAAAAVAATVAGSSSSSLSSSSSTLAPVGYHASHPDLNPLALPPTSSKFIDLGRQAPITATSSTSSSSSEPGGGGVGSDRLGLPPQTALQFWWRSLIAHTRQRAREAFVLGDHRVDLLTDEASRGACGALVAAVGRLMAEQNLLEKRCVSQGSSLAKELKEVSGLLANAEKEQKKCEERYRAHVDKAFENKTKLQQQKEHKEQLLKRHQSSFHDEDSSNLLVFEDDGSSTLLGGGGGGGATTAAAAGGGGGGTGVVATAVAGPSLKALEKAEKAEKAAEKAEKAEAAERAKLERQADEAEARRFDASKAFKLVVARFEREMPAILRDFGLLDHILEVKRKKEDSEEEEEEE